MEFLLLLIVFVAGWYIGRYYVIWQMRDMLRKYATEEFGMKVDAEFNVVEDKPATVRTGPHKLRIEKHQDTLYLFDTDTGQFVCQAMTTDELASLSLAKNIKYAVVLYGEKVVSFINGEVKLTT